jgi:hypothetical protein
MDNLTASEAREITAANADRDFDYVLMQVRRMSEEGKNSYSHERLLNAGTVTAIEARGFVVTNKTPPVAGVHHIIEWSAE